MFWNNSFFNRNRARGFNAPNGPRGLYGVNGGARAFTYNQYPQGDMRTGFNNPHYEQLPVNSGALPLNMPEYRQMPAPPYGGLPQPPIQGALTPNIYDGRYHQQLSSRQSYPNAPFPPQQTSMQHSTGQAARPPLPVTAHGGINIQPAHRADSGALAPSFQQPLNNSPMRQGAQPMMPPFPHQQQLPVQMPTPPQQQIPMQMPTAPQRHTAPLANAGQGQPVQLPPHMQAPAIRGGMTQNQSGALTNTAPYTGSQANNTTAHVEAKPAESEKTGNSSAIGNLKNVGTFMGYPEYTLPDAPAINEQGKDDPSREIQPELKEIMQGEKNGAQFYKMLSQLTDDSDAKGTLISISDRAEKRCAKLAEIFNKNVSVPFIPESKRIAAKIDYDSGVKLAVREESIALKSLTNASGKIYETSAKRAVNDIILEKLCQINELNLLIM